jgi:uncharacterized lipoprotein YmbA
MTDSSQAVSPTLARQRARAAQARLDARKLPTRTASRELIATVVSLAEQLEANQQALEDTQTQMQLLNRLIEEWNGLFAALRRAGLHLWEDLKKGICYQWQDERVVSGFESWADALQAALQERLNNNDESDQQ